MSNVVFTLGHSTHTLEYFLDLIEKQKITALCDVRSTPYSSLHHQFDRENLKKTLEKYNVAYVFLGKELGARSDDAACYDRGKIQYERLAKTQPFQKGLERIREGMKTYKLVLMCAEKEPLDCHRTILISRYLNVGGIEVQHIHADGNLESQEHAMERLLHRLHLPENHMFLTREELFTEAYSIQGERIAYTLKDSQQKASTTGVLFS